MNTFETNQMLAIVEVIKTLSNVVCKRSVVFTKALVVGVPGNLGSLMISQQEDKERNNYTFFMHYFPDHEPKKVADGQVCFSFAKSKTIQSSGDLLKFLEKVSKNVFPFSDKFLLEEFDN